MITDTKFFKIIVNGVEEQSFPWTYSPGQPLYAIFDLYGQCQKVIILINIKQCLVDFVAGNTHLVKKL